MVIDLPTYLMIRIASNVSTVVVIDILKMCVGIYMDALQTWLLVPLHVVDLVMVEERVALVDKHLVLTLFHQHLPSYLSRLYFLPQILELYLVMRLWHFDILFLSLINLPWPQPLSLFTQVQLHMVSLLQLPLHRVPRSLIQEHLIT